MSLITNLVLGTLYFVGVVQETKVYCVSIGDYKTLPHSPELRQKRATEKSYVCNLDDFPYDYKNGYETTGKGIKLRVNFFKVESKYNANVSWDHPTDNSRSKCNGYHVVWFKFGAFQGPYCKIIMNENITRYIVEQTDEMKQIGQLGIAVFPLPRKTRNADYLMRWFDLPKPTTVPTINTFAASSTTINPVSTKTTVKVSASSSKYVKVASAKMNGNESTQGTKKGNIMTTWVIAIIIVSAGIVSITIFLAVFRVNRNRNRSETALSQKPIISAEETYNKTANAHYISYYSDNDKFTETAIKIASWLKQQNLNVIMDKFDVITNGKRKWCDLHISLAKKVILIISPGYLKICQLDENVNTGKEKQFSFKDQLAYNEVCHIRDEIMKMPLATQRFVVILVETGYKELPFWMKRLNVYKYSGGMVDQNILKVLKPVKV